MLSLALLLAASAPPPLEGWWRPEGVDPHPSALPAQARARVTAAAVRLGRGRSGAFVSRDGLILTSATAVEACARRLRAEGRIGPSSFIAPDPEDAPVCPDLEARLRVESRDVGAAVRAAKRAGSTEVESALLGACRRHGVDRLCSLVRTEDGALRLLVHREIRQVRLRFYPGPALGGLGGAERAFDPPWLRLDAALVSVDLGRVGAPGGLQLARRPPTLSDEVWVLHHPGPTLRGRSALETERFAQAVLPAYRDRLRRVAPRHPRLGAFLSALDALAPRAVRAARLEELEILARIEPMALGRRLTFSQALTAGREAAASVPWGELAAAGRAEPKPPLFEDRLEGVPPSSPRSGPPPAVDPAALEFLAAYDVRRRARLAASVSAIGPDGQGDLRISRGVVVPATLGGAEHVPWGALLEAARRLGTGLPLPSPLPWRSARLLGFEIHADVGPFVTGSPVVDDDGRLVGVVSSGDRHAVLGFFRFDEEARVGVTSAHALALALARAFGAPRLAARLRP
jgi:hypothetical protein